MSSLLMKTVLAAAGGGAASLGLKTNLVAWWALDEASGSRADSHTNGLTLTDNNTVTSNPGVGGVGTAAQMTGANGEFLSRADDAFVSLDADTPFTWAFWVYFDALGFLRPLITKSTPDQPAAADDHEYNIVFNNATSRFNMTVGNQTTSATAVASTFGAPSTATWYFLACRHDPVANVLSISVNGGTVDTAAWSGGTQNGTGTMRFGQQLPGSYHDGRMAKVGFWKECLTDAQITQIYNAGAGRTYAEL